MLVPVQPRNSFRIILNLQYPKARMDNVLLDALKAQSDDLSMKNISRGALKELFGKSRVMIKGQRAKSSSSLAAGITYVDILLDKAEK